MGKRRGLLITRMLTQADVRLRVMKLAVVVRIKTEKQRLRAGQACLVRRPAARALLSARRSWGKMALAKREHAARFEAHPREAVDELLARAMSGM